MIRILALLIGISIWSSGLAQSSFEVYLTPGFGYRSLKVKSGTEESFSDSLRSMDRYRQNWGAGISYHHGFNRELKLHIGVQYRRASFTRVMEDLQFHDIIHPSIGRVEDLSQTVQKDAYFYHKYQYLSFPLFIETFIGPKYGRSKVSIATITGFTGDFLITDKTKVFLKGYTAGGKSTHVIDNDYTSNSVNIYGVFGGRISFEIGSQLRFNIQPNFSYPILKTSEDDYISLRVYQINFQTGVSLLL